MKPDIETIFLMPKQDHSYVSSSNVREVAKMGGNIDQFVPAPICKALKGRFSKLALNMISSLEMSSN